MIKTIEIGMASFVSPQLTELEHYYTGVLGLHVADRWQGRTYLASRSGAPAVTLSAGGTTRLHGVTYQIDPQSSITEAAAALGAHSVKADIASDPHPGVTECLRFADPAGLEIELVKQVPIGSPSGPAGVAALRLGHVSVLTPDVNLAARFYTEVLGFKIGDWVGDHFVFLRSNQQHHNINFIQSEQSRMHHIAFELQNTGALIASCDVLASASYPLLWGPVRHGPGHNVATYHKNPTGQITELFTEMDAMSNEACGYYDARPWHTDRPQKPKTWSTTGLRRDVWGPMPPAGFLAEGA